MIKGSRLMSSTGKKQSHWTRLTIFYEEVSGLISFCFLKGVGEGEVGYKNEVIRATAESILTVRNEEHRDKRRRGRRIITDSLRHPPSFVLGLDEKRHGTLMASGYCLAGTILIFNPVVVSYASSTSNFPPSLFVFYLFFISSSSWLLFFSRASYSFYSLIFLLFFLSF